MAKRCSQFLHNGHGSVNLVWPTIWTFLSYEPPEWTTSSWKRNACDVFKAHHGAAAQRGPRRSGPHKRLQQLPTAPLQETRLQKLLEHLPPICDASPLQHTVSLAPASPDACKCWHFELGFVFASAYQAFGGGGWPQEALCQLRSDRQGLQVFSVSLAPLIHCVLFNCGCKQQAVLLGDQRNASFCV